MAWKPQRAIMRTIALEIDGAQKRPKESQLRYPRNSCNGKNPVSRTSNENPVILFFFWGGGGTPGPNAKLTRYQQSSENSSEKKTTPRCQLSSCETNLMWCRSFKKDNFEKKFVALEKCLNVWSSRDLIPFGKITIIKSLALSKIIFISSVLSVLTGFVDQVNKSVSNFIWNHKPPKIKRSTMIGRIKDGGLSMPDFDIIGKSLKAGWVKRLLDPQAQSWETTPFRLLDSVVGPLLFKCNYHSMQMLLPFHWPRAHLVTCK